MGKSILKRRVLFLFKCNLHVHDSTTCDLRLAPYKKSWIHPIYGWGWWTSWWPSWLLGMLSTCRSTAKKWWAVRWRGVDRRAIKLSGQSPSFTVAVVGSWSLQQLPFSALSLPSKLKVAFSNAVLSAFHILEDFFFDIWTPRYTRIFLFVRSRKRCFDNPSRVKGTSIKAVPQVSVRNRLFLGSNEKET